MPLYIIVSEHTGSAAEYFAFIARQMRRATILGRTTAGAGNPITRITIGENYVYIPICEIRTKDSTSIEAKGVVPDIALTSHDWLVETMAYLQQQQPQANKHNLNKLIINILRMY